MTLVSWSYMLRVMSMGERIRGARERAGLRPQETADALEVSREALWQWENNIAIPKLAHLIAFCRLVGASLDEITGLRSPDDGLSQWERLGRTLTDDQRARLLRVGEAFTSYNEPKKPTG